MVRILPNPFTKRIFLSVPSFFLLLPIVCLAGSGTLNIEKKACFDGRLNIPETIKSGCQLETKVIGFIEYFAKDDFEKICLVDAPVGGNQGKALTVTITDVSGGAGGAWSGPKHLTVEGTLRQDGRIVGTFRAKRVTGGAVWGTYKGTCSLLGQCARTIGKDVALWLEKPTMNARLGDEP